MKALKPSHREKKRYLLIKGKDASKRNIEETILEFIGSLGWAESSPKIMKSNKNSLILAINKQSLNKIRTSFMLSNKDISIVRVSGNLGKLK